MRRIAFVGVGFLLMLAGVVFTLQGVGVLGGSVMSGVTFWAVAGPVIALAGLAMAALGARRPLALLDREHRPAYVPGTVPTTCFVSSALRAIENTRISPRLSCGSSLRSTWSRKRFSSSAKRRASCSTK